MIRAAKIKWYVVLLMGLAFSSPITSAVSSEISVYPDAGSVRYWNNHGLPSVCAGSPVTPQCALDTWESCNLVGHSDHCLAIGIEGMVYRPQPEGYMLPLIYSAYRPTKIVIVEEGDIPLQSRLDHWLKAGDMEISYDSINCDGIRPIDCDWEIDGGQNLFFRKNGKFWHLIA